MEPDHRDIQAMTANIVVDEHVRVCVPEPVCHRCLRPWPCRDVQWANQILLRDQVDGP